LGRAGRGHHLVAEQDRADAEPDGRSRHGGCSQRQDDQRHSRQGKSGHAALRPVRRHLRVPPVGRWRRAIPPLGTRPPGPPQAAFLGPGGPRIREQLAVLWSRRWSILGVVVAVVGAWAFMTARQAPVYEAHVGILVKPINLANKKVDLIMATEQRIAQSLPV